PEYIEVDITKLAKVGDGIRVKDVPVPANVKVLEDEDVMVAVATAPKVEETTVAAEGVEVTAEEGEEPEISVERGKKDEDDGE
ncbi:MAG TPA: hypothetical protein VIS72_14615, partial [Anaerolineales bacterium]